MNGQRECPRPRFTTPHWVTCDYSPGGRPGYYCAQVRGSSRAVRRLGLEHKVANDVCEGLGAALLNELLNNVKAARGELFKDQEARLDLVA